MFYTQEQLDFLRANRKTMTAKQITAAFNLRFGTDQKPIAISGTCRRNGITSGICGKFQKGKKPWNYNSKGIGLTGANETSFKKGHQPYKQRPIGSERICKEDGYLIVKTEEPNIWRHKHVVIYEQHYGRVPDGMIVRFVDGDPANLDPKNLEAITRQENLRLNGNGFLTAPAELKPALRMLAKVETSLYQKQRGI